MPTFTSVTLDRFLEPGEAKSSPKRTMPTIENKNQFADSSSFSFPPSPQIINQKRNFSQAEGGGENARNVNGKDVFVGGPVMSPNADVVKTYDKFNGYSNGKLLNVSLYNGNGDLVPAGSDADITSDDFFDPRDTLSVVSSADTEDCTGSFCNFKMSTPMAEFYDAPDELSEGGSQSSFRDVEAELRERRLSWLMEIEGRKQAEETLDIMKKHWERLAHKLSLEGLTLPSASAIVAEDEKESDPAEELCQQIRLARDVATILGRGAGKAEAEMELEPKIEAKDFEISRILQRLHYYEAVNGEMSLRNQEATADTARRLKQRRKRRQRWFWSAVGASVVCGSVALAWSFLPSASGSPPSESCDAPGADSAPTELPSL